MNTIRIVSICFITLFLSGCKPQKTKEEQQPKHTTFPAQIELSVPHYFNGEFSLERNHPVLVDCATGSELTITMDSVAKEVIEKYRKIQKNTNTSILGIFKGLLSSSNDIEKSQTFQLTLTDFIRFDTVNECDPQRKIIGEYVALIPNRQQPTDKFTLNLHPDYTYTFTIFNMLSNSTRKAKGNWYQLSEDMIALEITPLTNYQNKAYINYNTKELTFINSKRIYHYQEK